MNCISELFTERGVLMESAGLLVNKPGIFFVESGTDLRFYVDLASRIGVECSGMRRPVCKDTDRKDTVCIRENRELEKDRGRLVLFEEGLIVEAAGEKELAALTEYLVCRFPLALGGGLLAVKGALEKEYKTAVFIKEAELSLPEGKLVKLVFEADGRLLERFGAEGLGSEYRMSEGGSEKTEDAYHRLKPLLSQKLERRICMEGTEALAETIGAEPLLALALWESLSNFETVYPFALPEKEPNLSCICFREGGEAELLFEGEDLVFGGSGEALLKLLDSYMSREEELERQEWLADLEALAGGKKDLGQAASFLAMEGQEKQALLTKGYTDGVLCEAALDAYLSEQTGKPVDRKTCQTGRESKRWDFQFSWEGRDLWELFEQKVLPFLQKGDCVEITGRLSEEADVRRHLEERLQCAVLKAGAEAKETWIFRSYKSGSCWIEESVIPRLKALGHVKKIEIEFEAFINALGEESFEDEAASDYGIHGDHPEKWFDISTRWLQELFPVDEILARELLISASDVEFRKTKGAGHTYLLKAYDGSGAEVFRDFFDVKYVEKPYMNRYPSIGKTHVTTGWLSVKRNGQVLVDERIVTDIEKLWEAVELQVLPQLEQLLVSEYSLSGLPAAQPLFNRLKICTRLSEIDHDTGIRGERMSTLENMQEDLYFYILDWFKTLGERECGKALDHVGLIFPELFNEKEKDGSLEVVLYEDCGEEPCGYVDGRWERLLEEAVHLIPECFSVGAGGATLQVRLSAPGDEKTVFKRLEFLGEMLQKGIFNYYPEDPWRLLVKGSTEEKELLLLPAKVGACSLSEAEKDRMLRNDVIDYRGYKELLAFYSRRPELKIRPAETSYQGKKLFYLLYVKKETGVFYREEKLKTNRLTVLFNARHHGNEASGLNSAFLLLDRCLEDEKLQDLCSRVNILSLPWENIDGGELHCQVYKDHPKWLCHPARFNSTGFEFRKDYNNPDTIYGEARAIKKLWSRWLFDVITDNHGFEGHETTQPFSGYTSPWYKSFWIPRALYYGYIWFDESNEHTISFGKRVRSQVADFINEDEEIRERNRICLDRFQKYAEQWFPDRFRTEAFQDVIFYWMETNMQKRPSNFNLERPEVTTLDWTTEVSDETVTGDEMWLNVRAHLLSDLALLQVLKETELDWDRQVQERDGQAVYTKFRRRPLF